MPLFARPYVSEATAFINDLKAKKPELEAKQQQGRALLWDKPQDRTAQAEYGQARVRQKAYVYQTEHLA